MGKYTTLRKQLQHISRLAQGEPSYQTLDEIGKTAHEALREVDQLDTPPPAHAIKLQLVEAEKEAA
jgi:hypothetical protein